METSKTDRLPITVTVTISDAQPATPDPAARVDSGFANFAATNAQLQTDGEAAIAALHANADRPYFDEQQDAADRESYYAGLHWELPKDDVFQTLSAKLRDTHAQQVSYRPSLELYPWVDLHPDGKIHSIYSGQHFDAEEFIRMDLKVEANRQARLSEFVARAGMSFDGLEQALNDLEAQMPYNCEHSVPQSWFKKKAPMRGDLHHLFACEIRCNSSRGNQPFFEFPTTPAAGNDCGDSGPEGFEPKGGKGAVARATLYFLLRYPGAIGDVAQELPASRLPILLQWHQQYPVSQYERHRNQAIFQRQGNRNPLIDFPEYADRIGFDRGFGRPPGQPHFAFTAEAAAPAGSTAGKPPTVFRFGQPRPIELLQLIENQPAEFTPGAMAARTLAAAGASAVADTANFFANSRFKKLPPAPGVFPYRMNLSDIVDADVIARIEQDGQFVFHAVGDTGQHGHGAAAQDSVSFHMEQQIKRAAPADRPELYYHLGDVVYYSGELDQYPEQFYDPYRFYPAPIVAIPGNHDGDNVTGDKSLSAFVKNFCTATPGVPPRPGDSTRLTMTQPNVYFTLRAPFVTIIGLYSNVTGDLDQPNSSHKPQFDWLVGELEAADPGKFLVVAVHHPPFSADNEHGREKKIGFTLDEAFEKAGRLPHLVLTAHVHNYQRFERDQQVGGIMRTIPYIVAGAGGYAGYDSLHNVHSGVGFPTELKVKLLKDNDKFPGFLAITVSSDRLRGEYFTVPPPPHHLSETHLAESVDSFEVGL